MDVGNFSEPVSPYGGFGIDSDGDGLADASYSDYSLNGPSTDKSDTCILIMRTTRS